MLLEYDPQNLTRNGPYARYSLNFDRGQKRSFYVYMSIEVADKIRKFYKVDAKAIQGYVWFEGQRHLGDQDS